MLACRERPHITRSPKELSAGASAAGSHASHEGSHASQHVASHTISMCTAKALFQKGSEGWLSGLDAISAPSCFCPEDATEWRANS